MTEKWKKRLTLQGEFGYGVLAGVLVAAVPAALFMSLVVLPKMNQITSLEEASRKLQEENWKKAEQIIKDYMEVTGSSTVLYELEPGEGIEVLGGLIQVQPGRALGGPQAFSTRVTRWYIPVKVKPSIYGEGRGAAYAWYNRESQTLEGPFLAEVVK